MVDQYRRMYVFVLLLFLIHPLHAFSGDPADALVGSYAIKENGKLKEFVKITKTSGGYYISVNEGRWSKPKKLLPVPMAKYEMHFDKKVAGDIQGLGHEFVGVFKVRKGFRSGKYICQTGYVMAFILGAIDLHRL